MGAFRIECAHSLTVAQGPNHFLEIDVMGGLRQAEYEVHTVVFSDVVELVQSPHR